MKRASMSSEIDDILTSVDAILSDVRSEAFKFGLQSAFTIANTKKLFSGRVYFPPLRYTDSVVSGVAIVADSATAQHIAEAVDGKVAIIFVDVEKKIDPEKFNIHDAGNVELTVYQSIKKSRILPFKANDITVEAFDAFLSVYYGRELCHKHIAIIGAGNIGSKLALKLVERGCPVSIYRRDLNMAQAIANAINIIKPVGTLANVCAVTNVNSLCPGADILIATSDGKPVVTRIMINQLNKAAMVIDAGKGCISTEAMARCEELGITVLRIPISCGFEGSIKTIMNTEKLIRSQMGRRRLYDVSCVSGGIVGHREEIVLDNVHCPTRILGMANGHGDFLSHLEPAQMEKLKRFSVASGLALPLRFPGDGVETAPSSGK